MYCGTEVPETLTLNATTVVLTFESDSYVTERGFKIQFKVQSGASTGMKNDVEPYDIEICDFCDYSLKTAKFSMQVIHFYTCDIGDILTYNPRKWANNIILVLCI